MLIFISVVIHVSLVPASAVVFFATRAISVYNVKWAIMPLLEDPAPHAHPCVFLVVQLNAFNAQQAIMLDQEVLVFYVALDALTAIILTTVCNVWWVNMLSVEAVWIVHTPAISATRLIV